MSKLRIILLLFSITSSLLFIFIFFIRDIPLFSLIFKDYIDSGKSLFLPFIPEYNLIFYVPEYAPSVNFTVGHLIDTIIIINLYFYVETSVYHYIKRAYDKEELIYVVGPFLRDDDILTIFDDPFKGKGDFPEKIKECYNKLEKRNSFSDNKSYYDINQYEFKSREKLLYNKVGSLYFTYPPFIFNFCLVFSLSSPWLPKSACFFSISQSSSFIYYDINFQFLLEEFYLNFKTINIKKIGEIKNGLEK
ncbi:MAG: hypothetical protein EU541_05970 [Promethearchaeota archaeon]|nr:MAG: hypothetical protein EU541_05970 [Candidatus Lokiarchaeota archaeon]